MIRNTGLDLLLGICTKRVVPPPQHTGAAASRSQCSEAGDVCPICQGEYREPRSLVCQVTTIKTNQYKPVPTEASHSEKHFDRVCLTAVKAVCFLHSIFSVTSASLCGSTGRRRVRCVEQPSLTRCTSGETGPPHPTCRSTDRGRKCADRTGLWCFVS